MNFIGNPCDFNNKIKNKLTVNCTVISYFDNFEINDFYDGHNILLFPINTRQDYLKYTMLGLDKMVESGFESKNLKTYTSIFLYIPDKLNISDIIDTINNFDKKNLVDNIFLYPKLDNYQLRDNTVENLPFQKFQSNLKII